MITKLWERLTTSPPVEEDEVSPFQNLPHYDDYTEGWAPQGIRSPPGPNGGGTLPDGSWVRYGPGGPVEVPRFMVNRPLGRYRDLPGMALRCHPQPG